VRFDLELVLQAIFDRDEASETAAMFHEDDAWPEFLENLHGRF
jgi:hypothetical protein